MNRVFLVLLLLVNILLIGSTMYLWNQNNDLKSQSQSHAWFNNHLLLSFMQNQHKENIGEEEETDRVMSITMLGFISTLLSDYLTGSLYTDGVFSSPYISSLLAPHTSSHRVGANYQSVSDKVDDLVDYSMVDDLPADDIYFDGNFNAENIGDGLAADRLLHLEDYYNDAQTVYEIDDFDYSEDNDEQ